ncbi:hypothetical protein [Roseospira navarrensis]|uniref:Gluconate 2-dehydrogenase subunit 3 family protein n=1 Tax=Roseospira navarrensis TaxID=140058 RepID=A0A7X1ZH06_9PROT|nr:hypothetical protein [Roseospira navarrensis]MQX38202.1 hypothetical protein [Roseospira navarrensis]
MTAAALDTLWDAILPGDPARGLPPASQAGVSEVVAAHGLGEDAARLLVRSEAVARERFGTGFDALTPADRVTCVERARRADMRGLTPVLVAALRAYYTDPVVLRAMGAGTVPPFPEGNALNDDDWTLLEPVYERGSIVRPVPKEKGSP